MHCVPGVFFLIVALKNEGEKLVGNALGLLCLLGLRKLERVYEACVSLEQNFLFLLRLAKSEKRGENWYAMDNSRPSERKKYYINVCRPLIAVPGCDRRASVCQMKYEQVSVSTLSSPTWSWFDTSETERDTSEIKTTM